MAKKRLKKGTPTPKAMAAFSWKGLFSGGGESVRSEERTFTCGDSFQLEAKRPVLIGKVAGSDSTPSRGGGTIKSSCGGFGVRRLTHLVKNRRSWRNFPRII